MMQEEFPRFCFKRKLTDNRKFKLWMVIKRNTRIDTCKIKP